MMKEIKVLLVGESWMTSTTHFKGWDHFSVGSYETGADQFMDIIRETGNVRFDFLPNHQALTDFPSKRGQLDKYDVVILSDIGANTLLLHPDTFLHGKRTPNRLRLLKEWVLDGGGLIMAGGYYSFQGIHAAAGYHGTAVEDVLPVQISPYDDRLEVPEGLIPQVVTPAHPILQSIEGEWPYLLGLNRISPKDGSEVLVLGTGPDTPLLVVGECGHGRSVAWTTDIGPHWCPVGFQQWEFFGRLWVQILEWCVRVR